MVNGEFEIKALQYVIPHSAFSLHRLASRLARQAKVREYLSPQKLPDHSSSSDGETLEGEFLYGAPDNRLV